MSPNLSPYPREHEPVVRRTQPWEVSVMRKRRPKYFRTPSGVDVMLGEVVAHRTASRSYSAEMRAGSHLFNASAQARVAEATSALGAFGDCIVWHPLRRMVATTI